MMSQRSRVTKEQLHIRGHVYFNQLYRSVCRYFPHDVIGRAQQLEIGHVSVVLPGMKPSPFVCQLFFHMPPLDRLFETRLCKHHSTNNGPTLVLLAHRAADLLFLNFYLTYRTKYSCRSLLLFFPTPIRT